jgi:lysophospholipase L1-like esterase
MKHLGAVVVALGISACGGGNNSTTDSGNVTDGGVVEVGDDSSSDGTSDSVVSTDVAGSEASTEAAVDAGPLETLHFLGRFDRSDTAGPKFQWPASAVYAQFNGTGIDVRLDDGGNNLFEIVIDGSTTSVVTGKGGANTYTLASGLPSGPHDVLVFRRTESFFGTTQFLSFAVHGGSLTPSPAPFKRTIEIVGDSISCGYGNEGVGPTCGFTNTTENEYLSYASLTARALSAVPVTIAWSGKGIARNGDGSTTELVPALWKRTLPTDATSSYAFSDYVPDVVVVNLGTNDFAKGDPGTAFQTAWASFLTDVRTRYPATFILAAVGSMLGTAEAAQAKTYIQAAIATRKAAGDTRVDLVEFPTQDPADGYGCDYHPSLTTHRKMATVLTAKIKAVAGW